MSTRPSAHLFYGFEVAASDPLFSSISRDQELDCKFLIVGDDETTRYFVAALSLEDMIHEDGPLHVEMSSLQQKETDARQRLQKYCTKYGGNFVEPAWRLAAAYN